MFAIKLYFCLFPSGWMRGDICYKHVRAIQFGALLFELGIIDHLKFCDLDASVTSEVIPVEESLKCLDPIQVYPRVMASFESINVILFLSW